jgi:hypothetical protein
MGEVETNGVRDNAVGSGAGLLNIDCMMGNVRLDVV